MTRARSATPSRNQQVARRKAPPPGESSPADRVGWRLAIIAIAIAAAYANSLNGAYILDDELSIIQNEQIRRLWDPSVLFPERELPTAGRPVVNVTFAANYALGELSVRGYHVVNVSIHILSALLIFGLTRRSLSLPTMPDWLRKRATDLALAVALLWGLHPINTEAINYLTQRTESLMTLFYLLTVYASIRALVSSGRELWTAIAVVACALGMGCKESMVTAPVVIVLYDSLLVFGSLRTAPRSRAVLYTGLAASWLALAALNWSGPRVHSAGFSSGVDAWTYLLNQAPMIVRYLRLVGWPHPLVVNYGWPVPLTLSDVVAPLALIIALLACTGALLWRSPKLSFLPAAFFITLSPASSFVPIGTEVGAERRMYLPLIPLLVLTLVALCWAWDRTGSRRPVAARRVPLVTLAMVSIVFAVTTMARNREYRSALALAQTVVDRYPTPVGMHVLGVQMQVAGRRSEAIQLFRQATAGAPRAHYSLGFALYQEGQLDEARKELEMFVERQPLMLEVISARLMLGQIAMNQERWADAQKEFLTAVSMAPNNVEARGMLASALFSQRLYKEAIAPYRRYLAAHPRDADALTNLGVSLTEVGELAEAAEVFKRALEADPTRSAAMRNLATALFDTGDLAGAARYGEQALSARPDDLVLRTLLGKVFAQQGRYADALRQFEEVLRRDPNDAYAQDAIPALRQRMHQ